MRFKAKRSVVLKLHYFQAMNDPQPSTPTEFAAAINKAKPYKAFGPNGVSMIKILKTLVERGVRYLTMVFKL